MLGGSCDKWTRIMANFPAIEGLNIRCDHSHEHQSWGFSKDAEGRRVWATSLEPQYPRKMCIALVNVVLQFAAEHNLKLRAVSLQEDTNPLNDNRRAMISAGQQPKPTRLPPVVFRFLLCGSFSCLKFVTDTMFTHAKADKDIQLRTKRWTAGNYPKIQHVIQLMSDSSCEGGPTPFVEGGQEGGA